MSSSSVEGMLERWRLVLSEGSIAQRDIDIDAPLRLLMGADELGRALFLSLSSAKPSIPNIGGVVEAVRGRRVSDGYWTLSLTLLDLRFFDVFVDLCAGLVSLTGDMPSEVDALRVMAAGVEDWKDLFIDAQDTGMSIEEVRGLVAEIWFGFDFISRYANLEDVVHAWGGPLGAAKDFVLADGRQFEVKSVHPDSRIVQVSSAEQLDVEAGDVRLVLVTMLPVSADIDGSMSLAGLIGHVNERLDASTRLHFKRRLVAKSISEIADYAQWRFVATRVRFYGVSELFPAIRRSDIDISVTAVRYDLAISGITAFLESDVTEPWRLDSDRPKFL